jgi:hypothetical protein
MTNLLEHLCNLEWKMFQKKVIKKIKTLYVQWLLSKNRDIYEITWKNMVIARQATDDTIMLCRKGVICMLDNWGVYADTHS